MFEEPADDEIEEVEATTEVTIAEATTEAEEEDGDKSLQNDSGGARNLIC